MTRDSPESISLTVRAALAMLLMAGFYFLALAVLASLVLIVRVVVATSREGDGTSGSWTLFLVAVFGIVAIAGGLIPRRRGFVAPGPLVTPEEQPRLFEEIRRLSDATASPMPREVYIVADANAAVAHVGGFAGIGARPVMMLGLPLIAVMTASELRGVIAHEFGHYVGGETRLVPVVYRTREAIGRTIVALAGTPHELTRLIRFPFIWYGRMYLRATLAISRRQELAADLLAARLAGGTSMQVGLVKVHAAGPALRTYMDSELGVVLAAGYRPPIAEGFSRFLEKTGAVPSLEEAARESDRGSDPYDSHPSLKERLEALTGVPHQPSRDPDPPAVDLLRDTTTLEMELLASITRLDVGSLSALAWDEVGSVVWLPIWQRHCLAERAALDGLTPGGLPVVSQDVAGHSTQLGEPAFSALIGAALTVVLAQRAWTIQAGPGESVTATHGQSVLEPFLVLRQLSVGELPADEWRRMCVEAEIADIDLGEAAVAEPRI